MWPANWDPRGQSSPPPPAPPGISQRFVCLSLTALAHFSPVCKFKPEPPCQSPLQSPLEGCQPELLGPEARRLDLPEAYSLRGLQWPLTVEKGTRCQELHKWVLLQNYGLSSGKQLAQNCKAPGPLS